eukprot:1097870-Prymnesium_polylepis.1
MKRWRQRNRDLWPLEERKQLERERKQQGHGRKKTVEDEIANERARAEACKVDLDRIQRAAGREVWSDGVLGRLQRVQGAIGASNVSANHPLREAFSQTVGALTLHVDGGKDTIKAHLKELSKPRALADEQQVARDADVEMAGGDGGGAGEAGDDGSMPPEFVEVDDAQWRAESARWKEGVEAYEAAVKAGGAPAAGPPHPPLNPGQRAFARNHLELQRAVASARARGEGAAVAFQQLRARGLVPHQLLQGAGGVGKSVLFAAMQRVMRHLGLGRFVVSAWTGVASAPFGAATLCKMFKIDWDALGAEKVMTELDIATMREEFEAAYCDPKELLVLGVDE